MLEKGRCPGLGALTPPLLATVYLSLFNLESVGTSLVPPLVVGHRFHSQNLLLEVQTDLIIEVTSVFLVTLFPLSVTCHWLPVFSIECVQCGVCSQVSLCAINCILCQIIHHRQIILCYKYFRSLHQIYTAVFTILSAIKGAKFYLYSANVTKVASFGYIIYSSAKRHSQQCASAEE